MPTLEFTLNGAVTKVDADPAMPVLWLLRDVLNLTGTKYGCGIAACGACTVLVDGVATRTCVLPAGAAAGKQLTTIEGLSGQVKRADQSIVLHPVQQAWIDEQVPQCGYCQSGMIMAAVSLLKQTPQPTDAQIDASMTNLCRCGTYQRVRAAVKRAAYELSKPESSKPAAMVSAVVTRAAAAKAKPVQSKGAK